MEHKRLKGMIGGWFVGNFAPAAFRCAEAEVAVKTYAEGDRDLEHHHRVVSELTLIVSGTVRMYERILGPGDIVTIKPARRQLDTSNNRRL